MPRDGQSGVEMGADESYLVKPPCPAMFDKLAAELKFVWRRATIDARESLAG